MTEAYRLGFEKIAGNGSIDRLLSLFDRNEETGILDKITDIPKKKKNNYSFVNRISEGIALPASLVLSAIAGKKLSGWRGLAKGLKYSALANLGGATASAFTPTRTRSDQRDEDSALHILRNLIPGLGMYNKMKRKGYVEGGSYFD